MKYDTARCKFGKRKVQSDSDKKNNEKGLLRIEKIEKKSK